MPNGAYRRIQKDLLWLQECLRFGLDEMLKAALVDREQVAVAETALGSVEREVVRLQR